MTRQQAFAALITAGVSRRRAASLLRVAKASGTATDGSVRVGCHPYTRKYHVTGA